MVSLLSISQDFYRPLPVKASLGQDPGQQQTRLGQCQRWGVWLKTQLHAHHEEMAQDAQRHVMMPSPPGADFVIPESQ